MAETQPGTIHPAPVPITGRPRRAAPRFECHQPLVVERLRDRGVTFHGGRCRDLSVGGLSLVSGLTLEPGTDVRVKLKAPPRMVQLQARVVWSGAASCEASDAMTAGVRFTHLEPEDRRHLHTFLFDLAAGHAANDGSYDHDRR